MGSFMVVIVTDTERRGGTGGARAERGDVLAGPHVRDRQAAARC